LIERDRIMLRPVTELDIAFMQTLYAVSREAELAVVNWDRAQKDAFLQSQFAAQHVFYRDNYPGADRSIILIDQQPAGRLYVARWEREIRLMDIALMPEYCRQGVATLLIGELQDEARRRLLPLTMHVEQFNPARRLYERLGFSTVEERGVHLFITWSPGES
jgi:GNAT superfamily N-acetyltransferase